MSSLTEFVRGLGKRGKRLSYDLVCNQACSNPKPQELASERRQGRRMAQLQVGYVHEEKD